jgi:tRNA 2-selenouridine synthase
MTVIQESDYKKLLIHRNPVIDVRAPIEFNQGAFPGAINSPILDNSERDRIGKVYKQRGNSAAVQLGYELVSGDNKSHKVQSWVNAIQENPNAIVSCFRGGQRSQISQKWISDAGYDIPRFEKGYKHYRQWSIEQLVDFSTQHQFRIVSGTTGSGKTKLLKKIHGHYPVVDLEGLANHKGSAFGKEMTGQPSQADFENRLLQDIFIQQSQFDKNILFEDESRMIGSRHLTESFFKQLRSSPLILMATPLQERIENIFYDYVTNTNIVLGNKEEAVAQFQKYKNNTDQITKRLGGLRASEVISDIEKSEKDFLENNQLQLNKSWIEKLLVWYYDPLYISSLGNRNPVIEFQGSETEIINYLLG